MFGNRNIQIQKRLFGEVALRKKLITGGYVDVKTKQFSPGDIPEKCLISFKSNGGNGCILKKIPNPIFVKEYFEYAIAIVVTAAHVVCDTVSGDWDFTEIEGHIEGISQPFRCCIIKDLLRIVTKSSYCSNGYPYLLNGGDLALLLLLSPSDTVSVNEMDIEHFPISIGSDCRLAGIPFGMDSSLSYNYPYVRSQEEAKNRMKEIFHGPSQVIISEGSVVSNTEILEVDLSTCTGLSGSPVISNNKLIGIFCGGPPLPGHKQLFEALKCLHEGKYIESWKLYKQFENFTVFYEDFSKEAILEFFKAVFIQANEKLPDELKQVNAAISIQFQNSKSMLMQKIYSLILNLVQKFKNKDEICFNIALPTWGEGFRILLEGTERILTLIQNKAEISAIELMIFMEGFLLETESKTSTCRLCLVS